MKKPRLNWAAEPWSDDEPLECVMVVIVEEPISDLRSETDL